MNGGKRMTVTHFECSEADRRAIRTISGRPVSEAELRRVIEAAAKDAVRWAERAAASLQPRRGRRPGEPRFGREIYSPFREAFGTSPEFVPTWRPAGQRWDRGDIVRIRFSRAARILSGGSIRYRCWSAPQCRGCEVFDPYWGCARAGRLNMCIGKTFWRDWRRGERVNLGATLLHEAMHIYYPTIEDPERGKRYGDAECYVRYALRVSNVPLPSDTESLCPPYQEVGDFPPGPAGVRYARAGPGRRPGESRPGRPGRTAASQTTRAGRAPAGLRR
jgi:hypothetical protein